MNDFIEEEKEYLEKNGFIIDEDYDDAYVKVDYLNGDITIEKEDENCFTLHYDAVGDDLERANNNETKTDLTWKELQKLVGDDN